MKKIILYLIISLLAVSVVLAECPDQNNDYSKCTPEELKDANFDNVDVSKLSTASIDKILQDSYDYDNIPDDKLKYMLKKVSNPNKVKMDKIDFSKFDSYDDLGDFFKKVREQTTEKLEKIDFKSLSGKKASNLLKSMFKFDKVGERFGKEYNGLTISVSGKRISLYSGDSVVEIDGDMNGFSIDKDRNGKLIIVPSNGAQYTIDRHDSVKLKNGKLYVNGIEVKGKGNHIISGNGGGIGIDGKTFHINDINNVGVKSIKLENTDVHFLDNSGNDIFKVTNLNSFSDGSLFDIYKSGFKFSGKTLDKKGGVKYNGIDFSNINQIQKNDIININYNKNGKLNLKNIAVKTNFKINDNLNKEYYFMGTGEVDITNDNKNGKFKLQAKHTGSNTNQGFAIYDTKTKTEASITNNDGSLVYTLNYNDHDITGYHYKASKARIMSILPMGTNTLAMTNNNMKSYLFKSNGKKEDYVALNFDSNGNLKDTDYQGPASISYTDKDGNKREVSLAPVIEKGSDGRNKEKKDTHPAGKMCFSDCNDGSITFENGKPKINKINGEATITSEKDGKTLKVVVKNTHEKKGDKDILTYTQTTIEKKPEVKSKNPQGQKLTDLVFQAGNEPNRIKENPDQRYLILNVNGPDEIITFDRTKMENVVRDGDRVEFSYEGKNYFVDDNGNIMKYNNNADTYENLGIVDDTNLANSGVGTFANKGTEKSVNSGINDNLVSFGDALEVVDESKEGTLQQTSVVSNAPATDVKKNQGATLKKDENGNFVITKDGREYHYTKEVINGKTYYKYKTTDGREFYYDNEGNRYMKNGDKLKQLGGQKSQFADLIKEGLSSNENTIVQNPAGQTSQSQQKSNFDYRKVDFTKNSREITINNKVCLESNKNICYEAVRIYDNLQGYRKNSDGNWEKPETNSKTFLKRKYNGKTYYYDPVNGKRYIMKNGKLVDTGKYSDYKDEIISKMKHRDLIIPSESGGSKGGLGGSKQTRKSSTRKTSGGTGQISLVSNGGKLVITKNDKKIVLRKIRQFVNINGKPTIRTFYKYTDNNENYFYDFSTGKIYEMKGNNFNDVTDGHPYIPNIISEYALQEMANKNTQISRLVAARLVKFNKNVDNYDFDNNVVNIKSKEFRPTIIKGKLAFQLVSNPDVYYDPINKKILSNSKNVNIDSDVISELGDFFTKNKDKLIIAKLNTPLEKQDFIEQISNANKPFDIESSEIKVNKKEYSAVYRHNKREIELTNNGNKYTFNSLYKDGYMIELKSGPNKYRYENGDVYYFNSNNNRYEKLNTDIAHALKAAIEKFFPEYSKK